MQEIAVIGFTGRGCRLCRTLCSRLREAGFRLEGYTAKKEYEEEGLLPVEEGLGAWTKRMFSSKDALIFIGACGIAVRSIAPWLKSKWEDPAVLVLDEKGTYVISLLSGHVGGGNELALEVARLLGAEAVLTTATDVNHSFAVDVFAAANGLKIMEKELAKEASARILKGERLAFWSEEAVEGELPGALYRIEPENQEEKQLPEFGICIGKRGQNIGKKTLHLYPARLYVGIGCRRQTESRIIEAAVRQAVEAAGYGLKDVRGLYSIDLKAQEPGIREFSKREGLPFRCFSREELETAKGDFTPSAFVKEITGVDNVCERSAVLGSQGGILIQRKQVYQGVTAALALGRQGIRFD